YLYIPSLQAERRCGDRRHVDAPDGDHSRASATEPLFHASRGVSPRISRRAVRTSSFKSPVAAASMSEQPKDPATELKRLQRCINDLVSVLALPAVWSDSEPSRILDNFLDARARLELHEAPIDVLRTAQSYGTSDRCEQLRQALNESSWDGLQQGP